MRLLLSAMALLVCSANIFAQQENIDKDASPLELTAGVLFNDSVNPLILDDTDAFGASLQANGKLVATQESSWFQLDYGASYERFNLQDDQLEFDDAQDFYSYNVRILSRTFVTKAVTANVEASHSTQQQKYGEGITRFQENVLSVDTLNRNRVAASIVYGQDPSRNAVTLDLFWQDDRYDEDNDYAPLFDLSQVGASLEARYVLGGRVGFVTSLSLVEDDYASETRVDSTLYRALAGFDWQLSGSSNLRLLLGGFERDSDDGNDRSGFSYDLTYQYSPFEFSQFSLSSKRTSAVSEVEFSSNSIDVIHSIDWQYELSERWFWGLNLNYLDKDIETTELSRTLEQIDLFLRLGYNLNSYQVIRFDVMRRDVSSSDNVIDYQQNEVGLRWQYVF